MICQWLALFPVSEVGLLPSSCMSCWGPVVEVLVSISVAQEDEYFGVIICGIDDKCAHCLLAKW